MTISATTTYGHQAIYKLLQAAAAALAHWMVGLGPSVHRTKTVFRRVNDAVFFFGIFLALANVYIHYKLQYDI